LIDAKYLGKFIVDFLRETVRINPLRMTDEGVMISSNYGDVMALLATEEDVLIFNNAYIQLIDILDKLTGEVDDGSIMNILEEEQKTLFKISTLHLNKGVLAELKSTLTQNELEFASVEIQKYYTKHKLMDKDLLASFTRDIKSSKSSMAKATSIAEKILKRIKSIDIINAENSFKNLKKKIEIIMSQDDFNTMVKDVADQRTLEEKTSLASKQAQEGEGGQTTQQALQAQTTAGAQEAKAGAEEEDEGAAEEADELISAMSSEEFTEIFEEIPDLQYINEMMSSFTSAEVITIIAGIYALNLDDKKDKKLLEALDETTEAKGLVSYRDYLETVNTAAGTDATTDGDLKALLQNLITIIIETKKNFFKNYRPSLQKFGAAKFASKNIKNYPAGKKGFGMVKNHRVMKPAVMPNKPLKIGRGQMKKDELQFQVDLEKAKKKRGQPKAITGKGVCVEVPEDTYKTFGKHIIHYPQLRDMNTLNVKYPSKSKNYVPKLVVSAYYKDLMMDLLERGKYSDTLLDKLEESEKEHFHKIVKGAGLLEQFKLKTPSNDKIKQSAERFKVLRGNFLAGNNSPTLITELRSLILAFMERDIIQKKDGYEMLRELS
jgi:hypothetical protein